MIVNNLYQHTYKESNKTSSRSLLYRKNTKIDVRYIYSILVILFFGWLLLKLFSISDDATSSLISGTIIFFTLTLIASRLILKSNKWVYFFGTFFLLKLVISISHYLIFIDPNYFDSNGTLVSSFWHEYQSVFSQVSDVVSIKVTHENPFYFENEMFEVTHPEIWNLISIPLYYLGCYFLTITPINIFFTSLLSINLVLLARNYLSLSKKIVSEIAWVTSLFPMFLLADIFYRDQVGMGLLVTGITLLLIAKNPILKLISILLTLYFSYILRTVYSGLFLLSYGLVSVLNKYNRPKSNFILVPVIIVIITYFINIVFPDDDYISKYINTSAWLYLPIKIIIGVIGPFPWTQFIMYKIEPAISYQLSDYLLGVFQLSYLSLILQNAKRIFHLNRMDVMTIFGFGIALSGIVSKQMHIGYIAEGILLTLPWFFSQITFANFKRRFGWMFLLLILLNIVISLLGNIGLSALWR